MWTNQFKKVAEISTGGDYLAQGKILESHAAAKEALRVEQEANLDVDSFTSFIMDERGDIEADNENISDIDLENIPDSELTPTQLTEKKRRQKEREALLQAHGKRSEVESIIDGIIKNILQAQTEEAMRQAMKALASLKPEELLALQAKLSAQVADLLKSKLPGFEQALQNLMQLQQGILQTMQKIPLAIQAVMAALQQNMLQCMQQMLGMNSALQNVLANMQQHLQQIIQKMNPALQALVDSMQQSLLQSSLQSSTLSQQGLLEAIQQSILQAQRAATQGMNPALQAMLASLQSSIMQSQLISALQSSVMAAQQSNIQAQIAAMRQAQIQAQTVSVNSSIINATLAAQQSAIQQAMQQGSIQAVQKSTIQAMQANQAMTSVMQAQQVMQAATQSQAIVSSQADMLGVAAKQAAAQVATEQAAKQVYQATEGSKDPLSKSVCTCGVCPKCLGISPAIQAQQGNMLEMLNITAAKVSEQAAKQVYQATEGSKDPLSKAVCTCGVCPKCLGISTNIQSQQGNLMEMLSGKTANSNSLPSFQINNVQMQQVLQQQAMGR